jgi:hypothetical protein
MKNPKFFSPPTNKNKMNQFKFPTPNQSSALPKPGGLPMAPKPGGGSSFFGTGPTPSGSTNNFFKTPTTTNSMFKTGGTSSTGTGSLMGGTGLTFGGAKTGNTMGSNMFGSQTGGMTRTTSGMLNTKPLGGLTQTGGMFQNKTGISMGGSSMFSAKPSGGFMGGTSTNLLGNKNTMGGMGNTGTNSLFQTRPMGGMGMMNQNQMSRALLIIVLI